MEHDKARCLEWIDSIQNYVDKMDINKQTQRFMNNELDDLARIINGVD